VKDEIGPKLARLGQQHLPSGSHEFGLARIEMAMALRLVAFCAAAALESDDTSDYPNIAIDDDGAARQFTKPSGGRYKSGLLWWPGPRQSRGNRH